jgi:hypothetical protein
VIVNRLAGLLAVLLCGPLLAQDPEPPLRRLTDEGFARAEKRAKAHLGKSLGRGYSIGHVRDDSTMGAFPAHAFFTALGPPDGVKVVCLYAVGRDGRVATIASAADLERWFKANLRRRPHEAAIKTAALVWVRLGQELHQDGFYHFEVKGRGVRAGKGERRTASARAVVTHGGEGAYEAKLTFDREGRLLEVAERAKLRPGDRPPPPPDPAP